MQLTPKPHIHKGTFLIATPDIDEGPFTRGVLLICEHQPTGSFALLINKPLALDLPPELTNLEESTNPHVGIRSGGPANTSQMMLLHDAGELEGRTLEVCTGVYLGGDIGFLQETLMNPKGAQILLCFGYAGWGAGQLEREFLDGQWFIHPAQAKHLFEIPPERLWQSLLREMGGKYGSLSMIPEDLSVN